MPNGRIVVVDAETSTVLGEYQNALLAGDGRLVLDNSDGLVVFAAMEPGNIVAVDADDPTAMTLLGSISANATLEDPTAVMWNDGYLYVASSADASVSRIPVSDPTTLAIDATLDYASFTNVVDLAPLGGGSGAAACESTDSIVVASIFAVTDELIDTTYFNGLVAIDRDAAGLILYTLAATSQRLSCVDVSDRSNIAVIGSYSDSDLATAIDLAVSGNYVFAATTTKVIIVNMADPSTPVLVGKFTAPVTGTITGITASETELYITDSAGAVIQLNYESNDRVDYGEYPLEFDGDYDTDSRIHIRMEGPGTLMAITYEVDDTDNPPANGG